MKKPKIKMDSSKLKGAIAKHFEKVLFAVVGLCFVWLVYSAMNVERFTGTSAITAHAAACGSSHERAQRAGASRPRRVYNEVASLVEKFSAETAGESGYGLAGAVVGATYPEQLAELRAAMPHTWFLVPGFGRQGTSLIHI